MVIRLAANTDRIKESEYGCGMSIGFTAFDSCIGVVAGTTDGKIVGIHLVLIPHGRDGVMKPKDVSMVGSVLTRCGYKTGQPFKLVGCLDVWTSKANDTLQALSKLGASETDFVNKGQGSIIKAKRTGSAINIST